MTLLRIASPKVSQMSVATKASMDGRVDWVDYAKGFCIVAVVMMHSTLGVEQALGRDGFMHAVVEFAQPVRMPDFFLISRPFPRAGDRPATGGPISTRKVVHFVLFLSVVDGGAVRRSRRR